jgi:hypothetical protein
MVEHAVGHANGERRGLVEPSLELPFERRLLAYDGAGQAIHVSIHRRITALSKEQDAAGPAPVQ